MAAGLGGAAPLVAAAPAGHGKQCSSLGPAVVRRVSPLAPFDPLAAAAASGHLHRLGGAVGLSGYLHAALFLDHAAADGALALAAGGRRAGLLDGAGACPRLDPGGIYARSPGPYAVALHHADSVRRLFRRRGGGGRGDAGGRGAGHAAGRLWSRPAKLFFAQPDRWNRRGESAAGADRAVGGGRRRAAGGGGWRRAGVGGGRRRARTGAALWQLAAGGGPRPGGPTAAGAFGAGLDRHRTQTRSSRRRGGAPPLRRPHHCGASAGEPARSDRVARNDVALLSARDCPGGSAPGGDPGADAGAG